MKAYWSVDPQGIVNLVRDLYWFEQDEPKKRDEALRILRRELRRINPDRESLQRALDLLEKGKEEKEDTKPDNKTKAINILECLDGITNEQIQTILNGDASLIDGAHGTLGLIYREDKAFKKKLKKHQEWLDSLYITLAGFKVERKLLDIYTNEVVSRLRKILREPEGYRAAIMQGGDIEATMKIMEDTMELERLRKELHDEILESVGLNRERDESGERSEEYSKFTQELQDYLDKEAGLPYKA